LLRRFSIFASASRKQKASEVIIALLWPYKVVQRIGQVAYKLEFPVEA